MSILTRDRLRSLVQAEAGPCISLYIRTHRHHPENAEDPIRLKNALKEAERLLSSRCTATEVRALLDPVAALPQLDAWRYQGDGLGILRSSDMLEQFRLPFPVSELVVVADSFHVRPLIRGLHAHERYFLVAISQKSVALYQGSMNTLTRMEVPGLPESLAALADDRGHRPVVSGHGSARGLGGPGVHAGGGDPPSTEAELLPYFREIDRALQQALPKNDAPVILAGVQYYLPIYRKISQLKHLASEIVAGSPDAMTLDELQSRAWLVAEQVLAKHQDKAIENYHRAASQGRTSEDVEAIALKAQRGQVRRLFLADGHRIWGRIDADTGRLHRTDTQQDGRDDDVLDDMAESVLVHGGEVLTLSRECMPGGKEVAAEVS